MRGAAILAAVLTLLTMAPAYAEHNSAPVAPDERSAPPSPTNPSRESTLDITLKFGSNGFRFGSRIFNGDEYAGGAWLNGEARSHGFRLDGRLERDGRAHNFNMDVDVDDALRDAARWFGLTDL